MRKTSVAKRENIIKAAGDLFIQQGVDETSMDEIAAAAEVSKQTLYSHFGSKEGLFVEAIRDKCLLNNLSDDFFLQDVSPATLLLGFARRFMTMTLSDEVVQMQRTCIAQARQHASVSRLFYETGPQPLISALKNYFEHLHDEGRYCFDDTQIAAWQFLFMVRGDVSFRELLGVEQVLDDKGLEAYMRSSVDVFLRAHLVSV